MKKAVKKRRRVVSPDSVDGEALELTIRTQGNAIPPLLATTLRLVAPLVARLAVRYVARRLRRHTSEATVRSAGSYLSATVSRLIERYEEK